ncbi:ribosomal protein L22/L17 [Suillus paluster]|uniref:ribosomal protein L22/L17 n=1 Tax=Suillus paluster TaxID=48578 RepID=UPI001B86DC51|nr:ribosomal protein L22/L17 [Suillus paluster]KAG1754032.1 ribosomal protein L22/L17 [Suillus paluster]
MQAVARQVRCASRLGTPAQFRIVTSSHIQWQCQRRASSYYNPLQWIQEKFAPRARKVEEKRTGEQEKQGQQSAFEAAVSQEKGVRPKTTSVESAPTVVKKKKATEHKYSTANFKISHRKLNMIGRQISGRPIDHAIVQMQFSEKRATSRIKSMLATAKLHATAYKNMDPSKLVVAEAWVTKGPKQLKRLEPRGRGKFGIRVHPDSRMHVILREGKTFEQLKKEQRERRLRRIVSAGLVREDVPLRNPARTWQW